MKLFHLSDLHLGKRVNEFSMLDDQRYILDEILRLTEAERPDAVLIAGDVYDKSMPSAEAVALFDDFLVALRARVPAVLIISGNHDSPERIAFGGRLLSAEGIYLSEVYSGTLRPVTLTDGRGPVDFWLLPFLKPAAVRRFFPEAEITDYTDALRTVIAALPLDHSRRNVLLTHQFVTGSLRCESEELSVGGTDGVDVSVFADFDYVALGHIHSPQRAGADHVRYCGSPLKYSFSEAGQEKSVTVVELEEALSLRTLPLHPLRDLRELRGTYLELTARSFYQGTATDDYLHITLTDEDDVPEAISRLRVIYRNLMKLDYDNQRTRAGGIISGAEAQERRSPLELFAEFYEKRNDRPMSEAQYAYAKELMETIWEDER